MNTRTINDQRQRDHRPVFGDELPLAAHLVSPRRGYLHHGLYVGSGRVIHYAGLAGEHRRTVEEVSLEQFARGRAVYLHATPRFFNEAEAIRRARSRLGESRYRVLSNNCEHFCEWCLRGESRSAQVEELRKRPIVRGIARLIDTRVALVEGLQGLIRTAKDRFSAPSGAAPWSQFANK